MVLLYGTGNPAKLSYMRGALAPLPITLIGLRELNNPPPDAEETGSNPLENARIKALAYRDATGMTTLSADSGLYLDGVPDAEQPGCNARRVGGRRLSDEEMITHYAAIARRFGGRVRARYRNAACVATAEGELFERFDDSLASTPFYLSDTPHARRTSGFPLDTISVEIASGQYYFDLWHSRANGDLLQKAGFCAFVREALKL